MEVASNFGVEPDRYIGYGRYIGHYFTFLMTSGSAVMQPMCPGF
uniref:Uncharacterized protein n=1 Tax=Anguilla anguilla TaxID=7936 RepID=A0A0E9P6P5_ANGAN